MSDIRFVTCTEIAVPHLDIDRCIHPEQAATPDWLPAVQDLISEAATSASAAGSVMGWNGYPSDGVLADLRLAIRVLRDLAKKLDVPSKEK